MLDVTHRNVSEDKRDLSAGLKDGRKAISSRVGSVNLKELWLSVLIANILKLGMLK